MHLMSQFVWQLEFIPMVFPIFYTFTTTVEYVSQVSGAQALILLQSIQEP